MHLAARERFVVAKLACWKNQLVICETTRSLEMTRSKEMYVDHKRLRSQLTAGEKQLAATQSKLMKKELIVKDIEC